MGRLQTDIAASERRAVRPLYRSSSHAGQETCNTAKMLKDVLWKKEGVRRIAMMRKRGRRPFREEIWGTLVISSPSLACRVFAWHNFEKICGSREALGVSPSSASEQVRALSELRRGEQDFHNFPRPLLRPGPWPLSDSLGRLLGSWAKTN